jgi:hypothetical protein
MLDLHTISSDAPKNTRKFAAVIALVIAGFLLLLLSLAFLMWRKARRSKKGQFFFLQGFLTIHLTKNHLYAFEEENLFNICSLIPSPYFQLVPCLMKQLSL